MYSKGNPNYESLNKNKWFRKNNAEEFKNPDSYKRKNNGHETYYARKRHNQHWQNDDKPSFGQWKSQGSFKDNANKWQSRDLSQKVDFEEVPKPGKPRKYTISIAVPASILEETCVKDELRAYVIGQVARAANIFSVDEIVVYDDRCWRKRNSSGTTSVSTGLIEMMQMLLEYQECPQYLRKHLFQFHPHLRMAGILNALNSPHHLRFNQWCEYREGVVLEKGSKTLSYVDVGLGVDISIDKKLDPGLRVTVKLPPEAREMQKPYGTVVSPDEPRLEAGYYWGYTVRVANSLTQVVTDSRFPDGYDLLIGTSDKGDDIHKTEFPTFTHALIMFGGVEGLEAVIEADEELEAAEPLHLFDYYINTCPLQQTRTIRTEEAVLISLCSLQDKLVPKGMQ